MEKKKLSLKEIGIEKLIIMFLAGIFLIVLSFPNIFSFNKTQNKKSENNIGGAKSAQNESQEGTSTNISEYTHTLEENLRNLLVKVDGVGEVKVMITLKSSEEKVTLRDNPYSQESNTETDSEGGNRISSNISKEDKTVLIDNEKGDTIPYVIKETMPEIEGIVILAQGGGKVAIINEIIDASMVLFDVPAHKIKVMKME
jgi:stage III sporulation protein AG